MPTPAKMHRVHLSNVGEGIVYLPGGVPYQTDDEEVFPIGSFARFGRKGFVYAKSAGITNLSLGCKNSIHQTISWSAIGADAAIGDTQVTVTVGASGGQGADGTVAKDAYKGGEIMISPGGATYTNRMSRGIIGNDVLAAAGDMVVYLDGPITYALIEDTAVCEVMASPYSGVSTDIDGAHPVMGMATCIAASGKYLWIQVEGLTGQVVCQTDVGNTDHRGQCVFRSDGSIGPHDDADAMEEYAQHAGFIPMLSPADTQGLPFVMLQIAH